MILKSPFFISSSLNCALLISRYGSYDMTLEFDSDKKVFVINCFDNPKGKNGKASQFFFDSYMPGFSARNDLQKQFEDILGFMLHASELTKEEAKKELGFNEYWYNKIVANKNEIETAFYTVESEKGLIC